MYETPVVMAGMQARRPKGGLAPQLTGFLACDPSDVNEQETADRPA